MEYRRLGQAGVKLSVIGLGGWINFEAKIPVCEARRIVAAAYDGGVNYFDLADVYGHGLAERWMGAILKRYPRHSLVIGTKVFWPMSSDVNDRGLSRKHIAESIERSLAALGTDYVDIYFCHRYDPETPLLETARAMDDLVRQGKVLYWGTSEWEPDQIAAVCDMCERHGLHRPQVEQPEYSLLRRDRLERVVAPVTSPRGIGLTVYSPLAMGLLTGKYDDGIPPESRFARDNWSRSRACDEASVAAAHRLKPIAESLGLSRAQLALAWVLRDKRVTSAIVGASSARQMTENLRAAEASLTPEVVSRIEAAVAGDQDG